MTDFFEHWRQRFKDMQKAIAGKPHFEWAQVTGINPLRIQYAGDAAPLSITPSTLVLGLAVGDLVRVEKIGAHHIVHGAGKGADNPRRFALKSQLDAWSAIDGTHAWVTAESREYVRVAGQWLVSFAETPWTTLPLRAGFEAYDSARIPRYRIIDGMIEISGVLKATSGSLPAAPETTFADIPVAVAASHMFPVAINAFSVGRVVLSGTNVRYGLGTAMDYIYLDGVRARLAS